MNENDPYRYVGQGNANYMSTTFSQSPTERLEKLMEARFKIAADRIIAAEARIKELSEEIESLKTSVTLLEES